MRFSSIRFLSVVAILVGFPIAVGAEDQLKVETIYENNCASCHGAKFEGGSGGSLVDGIWNHGSNDDDLARAIDQGFPNLGMPAMGTVLKPDQIRALVVYLREKEKDKASAKISIPKPQFGVAVPSQYQTYKVERVVEGLNNPWALAFLPDGRKLVTEKSGTLRMIDAAGKLLADPVSGTPTVTDQGQGGLLAVAVHPDYAKNGWIYLAFSDPLESDTGKSMTAVVRGRLKENAWVDQQWIYRADEKFYGGAAHHFGTRIVFDQGYIYFVVGERGGNMEAQDIRRPNGKMFRLFDDGRIPPDNPFVSEPGAEPGIWSYGHRNPQGLTKDPRDNAIYVTEHGPRGGDEFNLIQKGRNYGWPVICYGMNYDGRPISALTAKEGMEQPLTYWVPSIAPSGLAIYMGDQLPKWKGDFFAGSLRAQELHRLRMKDGKVVEEETVLKGIGRIRDVVLGPDGALYLVLNGPDSIIRLVSAE